jgi:hypothetical protein
MIPDLNPRTDFIPADEMIIEDLDTLKVLADPLRLRIRELMTDPTTVKMVAAELNIPATKLYYHINLLEKHGLIVLVDTRIVSGIIEKHYQIAARSVQVARHLLSSESSTTENINIAVGGILDDTKVDLLNSVTAGVASMVEDAKSHESVLMASTRFLLNETQAVDFYDRLQKLVEEFKGMSRVHQEKKDQDVRYYKVVNIVFPTSRKQRPDDRKK